MADFMRRDSQQRLALGYGRTSKSNYESALAQHVSGSFERNRSDDMANATTGNENASMSFALPLNHTSSAMQQTGSGLSMSSQSKAKTKLNLLQMLKTSDNETFREFNRQMTHYQNASLYKAENAANSKSNLNIDDLHKKLKTKYLEDSESLSAPDNVGPEQMAKLRS